MKTTGFVQLKRTDTAKDLLRHKNAAHLLQVIAFRARYTDEPNLNGLVFGEALIGDHEVYGMTRKEDRVAREKLSKWKLASFRSTPEGTIARLLDSRVYALTDERNISEKGQQEGQQKGHRFSEAESQDRATDRASDTATEGPSEGHQRATEGPLTYMGEEGEGEEGEPSNTSSPRGDDPFPEGIEETILSQNPDIEHSFVLAALDRTRENISRGDGIGAPIAYAIGLARKMQRDADPDADLWEKPEPKPKLQSVAAVGDPDAGIEF